MFDPTSILRSEIDSLTAEVFELKAQIAELKAEIAALKLRSRKEERVRALPNRVESIVS